MPHSSLANWKNLVRNKKRENTRQKQTQQVSVNDEQKGHPYLSLDYQGHGH